MIYARELEGSYCLIFSCIGKPYYDPDIRLISENDREQILSITNVPDDENEFAKSISQTIAAAKSAGFVFEGTWDFLDNY